MRSRTVTPSAGERSRATRSCFHREGDVTHSASYFAPRCSRDATERYARRELPGTTYKRELSRRTRRRGRGTEEGAMGIEANKTTAPIMRRYLFKEGMLFA